MSLISPDFKEGKAILFIGMEGAGSKAKFYITDEAKEFLQTVRCPLAKPVFKATFPVAIHVVIHAKNRYIEPVHETTVLATHLQRKCNCGQPSLPN
jgi:hypothetical protein